MSRPCTSISCTIASASKCRPRRRPVNIIAATSKNGVIGRRGQLPWALPADRKFFMDVTRRGVIILGRSTFQKELKGRPIAGRLNIVLSANPKYRLRGALLASSVPEALQVAQRFRNTGVWIAGGSRPYRAAISIAQKLYLTHVHMDTNGDTFFPEAWRRRFKRLVWQDDESGKPFCSFRMYHVR